MASYCHGRFLWRRRAVVALILCMMPECTYTLLLSLAAAVGLIAVFQRAYFIFWVQ